jgi:Fe-S-cluster containining protein
MSIPEIIDRQLLQFFWLISFFIFFNCLILNIDLSSSQINFIIGINLSHLKCAITPRRPLLCGVYLLFLVFTTSICRFDECQPLENARIAWLPVCWVLFSLFSDSSNLFSRQFSILLRIHL